MLSYFISVCVRSSIVTSRVIIYYYVICANQRNCDPVIHRPSHVRSVPKHQARGTRRRWHRWLAPGLEMGEVRVFEAENAEEVKVLEAGN